MFNSVNDFFFFKLHLFVRYCVRSLRTEAEPRHLETAHIIKGTKCHGKTQKEGSNLDGKIWEIFMEEQACELSFKTDEEDLKKQKSRNCVQGQKEKGAIQAK